MNLQILSTAKAQRIILSIFIVFIIYKVFVNVRNRVSKDAKNNPANLNKSTDYTAIARRLYNALDGLFDSASSKDEAMAAIVVLNDDEVIEVYNRFNRLIGFNTSETMRSWIYDEWLYSDSKTKLLQRLDSLGLA